MKKIILSSIAALAVLLLTACGSAPAEKEVTASNVEISGFLKNYVKVIDGTYKFTNDGDDAYISVKFELIEQPTVEYCTDGWKHVQLNPVSADGQILSTGYYGFTAEATELNKIKDLLTSKVGDTKNISFKWDYFDSSDDGDIKIFTDAATFEVIDETFSTDCEDDEPTTSQSSSSSSSASSSSDEWDAVLDEYEEYMDSYIKMYKKAQAGDMDAMTEYVTLLEKAESFQNKLDNAKSDLSVAQMNRFSKIISKMASAM